MLTTRTRLSIEKLARLWVVLTRAPLDSTVLPGDVLAVLVGVVGHRIEIRAVEKDKSLFWGSCIDGLKEGRKGLRVEDVVREVVRVV